MLLFHMGDAYFFWNELVKSQATSQLENSIFQEYNQSKFYRERTYGRLCVVGVFAPYFYQCFRSRGMAWKVLVFYFLATSLNGFYDLGVYLHFFVHGPKAMRKCLDLPKDECFSPIQVNLFMRHAADNEI